MPKPHGRFVAGADDHIGTVGFAQAREVLFNRVQIVADRTGVSDVSIAAPLGGRRRDRVFVDIQTNIEFSFHSVCLLVRSSR